MRCGTFGHRDIPVSSLQFDCILLNLKAQIRQILKSVDKHNQYKKSSGNDPIHDQDTYITGELREKLEEKGIYAQAIIQCKGDCVFIPQVDI